jgi:DNA polymerase III subunit gamma/tau
MRRMSYLVLARKYRPRNFTELVGQDHVVQALSNALTQQRLHHAYMFTGTRGVGKTTVSRILAKSLNCLGTDGRGGITASPCGNCLACNEIDAGRFVDYIELDAASNRGVDEVQGLLEQAIYKPVQGRFKVFMIDEVHMLTTTAFNAMLKTLEEPPEYLKFVLATTDPQKVPVTVLSRCLQFNLRPMPPETVRQHLQRVLQTEGVWADTAALHLLARAAQGSMRDALSLTDQAIAFGNGKLQEASVRAMLGSADRGHVLRLIDALARNDGRTVVDTVEALRLHGLNAAGTLEEMAAVLQRMAVMQSVPERGDPTEPDVAEIARLASQMPTDETQLLYSLCLHGRTELGLAADEYAALTMVLLRLLAFKPNAPLGTAEKKTLGEPIQPKSLQPNSLEAQPVAAAQLPRPLAPSVLATTLNNGCTTHTAADTTPAAAQRLASAVAIAVATPSGQVLPVLEAPMLSPDPAQRAARRSSSSPLLTVPLRVPGESRLEDTALPSAATLVPTHEGDFWHATVVQLVAQEAVTALARELALQSQLVARDNGHWLLRVERESLNQAASCERLRCALQAAGHDVALGVEIGRVSDSPARRNQAQAAEKHKAAESSILSDPFVQEMMRDFGAKIVPGSIQPAHPPNP